MEDVEGIRYKRGRHTAFFLFGLIFFTILLISSAGFQVNRIGEEGSDDEVYDELAILAISFFSIVLPIVFLLLYIPPFISSLKWVRGRYTRRTRAALIYMMMISLFYLADVGLITVGDIVDGYWLPGIAGIGCIIIIVGLIVRSIQFLISMKGYR